MNHVSTTVTTIFAVLLVAMILSLALEEKIHAKKSVIAGVFAIICLLLGAVCGVLSIMMPAFRADEARLHQCGALLLEALRGHLFADDHSPGWQTQKQHP